MKFSEKIIELRKQKGLSQEELAEKLDVARQTVSKWELGETSPDMNKLIKISEIFNISIDELVENKHSKEEENTKKPKKKIFKLIIKIIIAIIIIYLILVLRRGILLLKLYKNLSETEKNICNNTYAWTFVSKRVYQNASTENGIGSGAVRVQRLTNVFYNVSLTKNIYESENGEKQYIIEYINKDTQEDFKLYCDEDWNLLGTGIKEEYVDEQGNLTEAEDDLLYQCFNIIKYRIKKYDNEDVVVEYKNEGYSEKVRYSYTGENITTQTEVNFDGGMMNKYTTVTEINTYRTYEDSELEENKATPIERPDTTNIVWETEEN